MSITGAVVAPRFQSNGTAATREEAKAAFAETWRAYRKQIGSQPSVPIPKFARIAARSEANFGIEGH